ncbi:hypothetical protein V9L05_24155 (plasmid) [Bernardetia sp. Wsw4-3y2]|uniref:hypothetical protein n=1 Tax=Bernardetia sp. Wsw4-3y2 TaxID=3127471 RepID=UPI0030D4EA54
MFFYDPQDTSNSVAIKPLTPLELKIIKVIDKDSKSVTSINANEEYTYIASQKGNDITQLKWCFWIDKRDDDFDKEYTIEITATADKADMETDFFLTSKVEGDEDKKKENTKLLKENAILSATITTETHDIGGKQQEVAVLKVKYSKWLDGEKIRVEIYKYNDKNKKPTRNSSKEAVCSRTVIAKPEVAEVYWMAADGEKLEETGYSEDIYLYIKTLGLKDKTLELNIYDDDITPKPIVMENEDDYVAWSGNKIKVEERDSIKQFKVGSKERYENARKDEIEDEKPKENDFLQVNFDFNKINDSGQKQDPEILELYVAVNNATDLKLNSITYQTKFGKLKLTPKEQVVDAFFAKPKKESVIADLPLGKDKNKQDTNKKTEVNHYEKLEKGVIGQKITLVAECDNLEGKDVAIYIYEKKPLLEAKDTKLKVIQNDKEVEKVCATVKDGYAVAEIQLQKPDSAKYKAWDKKLDPDTGDEKSSELYLKVVVEGVDSPATNKEFLKTGKEKFELRSVLVQHIYHNGEISKEEYEGVRKIKYVYHDANDKKYDICKCDILEVDTRLTGIVVDTVKEQTPKTGYDATKIGTYSHAASRKKYVYPNGTIITYGKFTNDDKGTSYRSVTYNKGVGKSLIVKMPKSLQVAIDNEKFVQYKFTKTQRTYCKPELFAGFIGALAEVGYTDIVSGGMCEEDATCYPSTTHINGESVDTNYIDNERQQKFINAMYKFGFSTILRGSAKKKFDHTKDGKALHNNHLHSGGFKGNFR